MTPIEVAQYCLDQFPDLVVSAHVLQEERKIRLDLRDGSILDIFVGRSGRYSYHWQRGHERYRFNIAPRYDQITVGTAPHHLHTPGDPGVQPSVARGVSPQDISAVLRFIAQRLS